MVIDRAEHEATLRSSNPATLERIAAGLRGKQAQHERYAGSKSRIQKKHPPLTPDEQRTLAIVEDELRRRVDAQRSEVHEKAHVVLAEGQTEEKVEIHPTTTETMQIFQRGLDRMLVSVPDAEMGAPQQFDPAQVKPIQLLQDVRNLRDQMVWVDLAHEDLESALQKGSADVPYYVVMIPHGHPIGIGEMLHLYRDHQPMFLGIKAGVPYTEEFAGIELLGMLTLYVAFRRGYLPLGSSFTPGQAIRAIGYPALTRLRALQCMMAREEFNRDLNRILAHASLKTSEDVEQMVKSDPIRLRIVTDLLHQIVVQGVSPKSPREAFDRMRCYMGLLTARLVEREAGAVGQAQSTFFIGAHEGIQKLSDAAQREIDELDPIKQLAWEDHAQACLQLHELKLPPYDKMRPDLTLLDMQFVATDKQHREYTPAPQILAVIRIIESCREECLQGRGGGPYCSLPPVPDRGASRDEHRTYLQMLDSWTRGVAQVADSVVSRLLASECAPERLALLAPSEMQELFLACAFAFQRLSATLAEKYRGAGAVPEEFDVEHAVRCAFLHTFLREVSADCPQAGLAILSLLRPMIQRTPVGEDIPEPRTAAERIERSIVAVGSPALSDLINIRHIAGVLQSQLPPQPHPPSSTTLCSITLRRNPDAVTSYMRPTSDGTQYLVCTLDPYGRQVMFGHTFPLNAEEQAWGSLKLPTSPRVEHNIIVLKGTAVTCTDRGVLGQSDIWSCPMTHGREAQQNIRTIVERVPSLDREMRKALLTHCPLLLAQEDIPEPLYLVKTENGMVLLTVKQHQDRVCALTGGRIIEQDQLPQELSPLNIAELTANIVGIRLEHVNAHRAMGLSPLGGVEGEYLAGSTPKGEQDEGEGGADASDTTSLPRLDILIGLLKKHGLYDDAEFDPDRADTEDKRKRNKHRLPTEIEDDERVTITHRRLGIQFWVTNQRGRAAYFIQGCNSPSAYVNISPKEMRDRFGAERIAWDSQGEWTRKVDQLLQDCVSGGQFLPARRALRNFPDAQSLGKLRQDMEKLTELHNRTVENPRKHKKPWELTVGNIHAIRTGPTWQVGVTGCGDTWLTGVAHGFGLTALSRRQQVRLLARIFGMVDASPSQLIIGFARELGMEAPTEGELKQAIAQMFNLMNPTDWQLVEALAHAYGEKKGDEILPHAKLQYRYMQPALHLVQYTLYPEFRAEQEEKDIQRFAEARGYTVPGDPAATRERVMNILVMERRVAGAPLEADPMEESV